MPDKYDLVVGLEVHIQLLTKSKIFATDSTEYGADPNRHVSVVTLGHPGTLPKLNKKVIEYAIRMGLACNSRIERKMIFDRKNYFYPDLPKGYQITQDMTPVCVGGEVKVKLPSGEACSIALDRIHMEEDAGKSMHVDKEEDSLIDYNRAGVPLIELVTKPVLRSAEEASAFLSEVRRIVRYLDICDGNMEQGSLRCDANVSVKLRGSKELGKKVEVKNMNSMRNVKRAIDHEFKRQIELIENGEQVVSETRTFDADKGTTAGMRTKEELNDYRYFPEPDLSPMVISEEWIEDIQKSMPALPQTYLLKFTKDFGLPEKDAELLIDTKEVAYYFEDLCTHTSNFNAASKWVIGPLKSYLNEHDWQLGDFPLKAQKLAALIELVDEEKVSLLMATKKILPVLFEEEEGSVLDIAQRLNLIQDSDQESIAMLVEAVLKSMPEKVKEYKDGKKGLIGLFVGEVMKRSDNKADPKLANTLLRKALD